MRLRTLVAATFLLSIAGSSPAMAQPQAVTLELALISDVSGSIDGSEFNLIRTGYVNAFSDFGFWDAFGNSGRTLAVSYSYWSGGAQQAMMPGGWYFVNDGASAQTFANAIAGYARPFSGLTAPGSAINWIAPQFATNDYTSTRQVIDIAADGCQNDGANTASARNSAQALGITINAITIGNEGCTLAQGGLNAWYTANAVTNDGFSEAAVDFADFEQAIVRKIGREVIGEVPEPASALLLGAGMLGLGMIARRRRHSA